MLCAGRLELLLGVWLRCVVRTTLRGASGKYPAQSFLLDTGWVIRQPVSSRLRRRSLLESRWALRLATKTFLSCRHERRYAMLCVSPAKQGVLLL